MICLIYLAAADPHKAMSEINVSTLLEPNPLARLSVSASVTFSSSFVNKQHETFAFNTSTIDRSTPAIPGLANKVITAVRS